MFIDVSNMYHVPSCDYIRIRCVTDTNLNTSTNIYSSILFVFNLCDKVRLTAISQLFVISLKFLFDHHDGQSQIICSHIAEIQ